MLNLPFVIYADFESILSPIESVDGVPDEAWTVKQQEHIAVGFATYTKCIDQRFYREPFIYTGENSAERFIDHVLAEATEIRIIYRNKFDAVVSD